MLRRVFIASLCSLLLAGTAAYAADKEADGTVKAVSAASITVTDSGGKDWVFGIDKDTTVVAKGGTHKMDKLKADGKPTLVTEFVTEKAKVGIKYAEMGGKMVAKEVRVK